MTSDQIQRHRARIDHEVTHRTDALWEIALQLAVMNERATKLELLQSSPCPGAIAREFPANVDQALGSSVPAGSESAVRGDDDPDATSIEYLPLSVRAYNCLKNAGINSIERFLAMNDRELFDIKQVGKQSLKELRKVQAAERTRRSNPQAVGVGSENG